MKLLLCYPSAEFSTYDVAVGIHQGLESEGHEIESYRLYQRIKLAQAGYRQWKGEDASIETCCEIGSEALPYRAVISDCDWVLVINGMGLHPNALWALKQIGKKVAIWFTEAPYDSTDDRELYLTQFADIAFVNERTCVDMFQRELDKHGGIAQYMRHAYNPEMHKPGMAEDEHKCDVLLVGTGFAERQMLFEAIDWEGIDLRLGGLWPGLTEPNMVNKYLKYPCTDNADTVRLYQGAKIVLNPHRAAIGAESANPRTFEVAACGAFQISDYRAEIEDIFGEAIPMYQPGIPWQLAGLIRRYLRDDIERERLTKLAQERIKNETFQARARQIVKAINEWEQINARKVRQLIPQDRGVFQIA